MKKNSNQFRVLPEDRIRNKFKETFKYLEKYLDMPEFWELAFTPLINEHQRVPTMIDGRRLVNQKFNVPVPKTYDELLAENAMLKSKLEGTEE